MRILLILFLASILSACTTDEACGPFNFRETAFSQRDTFNFNWTAERVWIDGLYTKPKIIFWEHRDSVRMEFFAHGVTYNSWKANTRGHRFDDSSFSYWIMDSLTSHETPGASVDCSPASYNITKEMTLFVHKDKHLVIF